MIVQTLEMISNSLDIVQNISRKQCQTRSPVLLSEEDIFIVLQARVEVSRLVMYINGSSLHSRRYGRHMRRAGSYAAG